MFSIPIDAIEVLNPRARNKRIFEELVDSIAKVGLKRPITVRRAETGEGYELVCGQGRKEAFQKLGQSTIPALVVDATRVGMLRHEPGREPRPAQSFTARTHPGGWAAARAGLYVFCHR
ncbi:ParB N-terminal domain-containing protein [Qipengyuania flava]|uniref:ParB N-terminal domain-containing protein n=1 Tax=Qipengyuania flava TaxID=192812 RepID=UPI001CD7AF6B|nr:ParB N-terminal domain-containing protein [Qipengyuania flava]MCA0891744.1 ParB N-terminal domain-containing protein [Qipengyuania flava]